MKHISKLLIMLISVFSAFMISANPLINYNDKIGVELLMNPEDIFSQYLKKEVEKTFSRIGLKTNVFFTDNTNKQSNKTLFILGTLKKTAIKKVFKENFKVSDLKTDGFFVKSVNGKVFIGGRVPRAVLYGFYDFLEKEFNFSWSRPADTLFPKIQYPVNIKEYTYSSSPAFSLRGVANNWYYGYKERIADWAIANKLNYIPLPVRLLNYDKTLKKAKKRDMITMGFGHSFYFWLPSSYFKKHPEYFSLIKGKRRPYPKVDYAVEVQLNNGNPQVIKIVVENIKKFHRKNPNYNPVPLVMNDGYGWCESPEARADDNPDEYRRGVYSTRYMKFVNRVAKEIYKEYPKLKISILSYSTTAEPPKVKPFKNIVIGFCTYRRCYKYTLNDPRSSTNRQFNKNLKGWLAFGNPVFIYDYMLLGGLPEFPVPFLKTLQQDLIYYKKLGIFGYYTECPVDGYYKKDKTKYRKYYKYAPAKLFNYWTGMKINYYLLARLLWNPKQNLKKLTEKYFSNYFGKAGIPLRKIYELIEKNWYADPAPYTWNKYTTNFPAIIFKSKQDISLLKKYSQKAMSTAKFQGIPAFIDRVAKQLELIEDVWLKSHNKLAGKKLAIFQYNNSTKNLDKFKEFTIKHNSYGNGFQIITHGKYKKTSSNTRFYAAYDNMNNLLILVEGDTATKAIKVVKAAHDGRKIWENDTFELFIASGPLTSNKPGYFHLATTPAGDSYDAYLREAKWESNTKIIVEKNKKRWRALFRIPLSSLGYKGQKNEQIKINLGRYHMGFKEASSWTDGSFHNPSSFGILEIK